MEGHREVINDYFKPLGFEVEINKIWKTAQLVNVEQHNKYKFNLMDSITLLILRILYHEKMEELRISDNVMITVSDIQEKFIILDFKDRLIDKTSLRNSLSTLRRFNILRFLDKDITMGDTRIIIYPTILMVVRSEKINKVFDKLDTYKRKGVEESEEAYVDQDD